MNINRRNFLFGSTAAAALAGCSTFKRGTRELKPGERYAVAIIGCGIQSRTLMPQFFRPKAAQLVEVVACCDCDKTRAAALAAKVNERAKNDRCRAVTDFREILADESVDAVCIATPDHWHAYMSVEAMKHGKDVYCEKPLTFSIDEAKKVIAAQEKYGRVFQTGSMQRSWPVFRDAVSLVRGGLIGDVLFVDANYGRGGKKLGGPSHPVRYWDEPDKIGEATPNRHLAPERRLTEKSDGRLFRESDPNPDVDWNMWLGPAAMRPYSDQLAPRGVHAFYPMFWRFDDDIGSGYNGDWGAHHLDIAQWGLDMDKSGPYRIIRSDEPYSANPFHGGRRQFGMKMLFKKPYGDVELYHGPFGVWGTVFYGTKGIVAVNRGKIAVWVGTGLVVPNEGIRKQIADVTFMPDKLFAASVGKDYGTDSMAKKDDRLAATLATIEKAYADVIRAAGLYRSENQVENFCECIASRRPTISPAEVGGRGATLCLLCNMSYRYDTGFEWDGEKMDFPEGTNTLGLSIRRDVYRNGWDVVV